MSFNGFGGLVNGGDSADPFGDTPQQGSMTAPRKPINSSDVVKIRKRSNIGGGSRVSSFGLPRNRAPSTSATFDFAQGVARIASIGNASPIAECDDMDIDTEEKAPTPAPITPIRRSERTPLEPIMNDLQIDERCPAPSAFGNPWDGSFGVPRSPKGKGKQIDEDDVFGSFGPTSSSPKRNSFNASFNSGPGRPAIAQSGFGSFQSDATSSFDSLVGRPPAYGISFMDGMGSMRSTTTNLTAPSPFGSLRSEKSGFSASEPAPLMAASCGVGSAADLKWTHDEDRYIIEMYDKCVNHGMTGVVYLSQSTHAPPKSIVKIVTRNAIAFWYIANFANSESFGAINEELPTQRLPTRMELAEWVPEPEEMQWISRGLQWRHDQKSTQMRLSKLVADRFKGAIASGRFDKSDESHRSVRSLGIDAIDEPNKSKAFKGVHASIIPADKAGASLANMFSMSDSASAASGSSIPLGSTSADLVSVYPRCAVNSMGPPPVPARREPRNVEMQIGTGVRTSVAPSSLPGSFRASGASPTVLGRVVKSLRGVPGDLASTNASGVATTGHTRQAQSLSVASGSRAMGSSFAFGPPLSSVKGKKRSREESADTEFDQRHSAPSPVSRNSQGFDEPRKEDDMFGPPSVRDDRSQNGKRQNRAGRSLTLMAAASGSSTGANTASVDRPSSSDFQPRALVFTPSAVRNARRPSTAGRGSNHAPSSSMPSSMPSSLTGGAAWLVVNGVIESRDHSIAEAARVFARHPRSALSSIATVPPAPGSLVELLPQVTGPITPEMRRRDHQHLQDEGFIEVTGGIPPEIRQHLFHNGLPMGMTMADMPLLRGMTSVNTYNQRHYIHSAAAAENAEVIGRIDAMIQAERVASMAAMRADHAAVVASLQESQTLQPAPTRRGTGFEGYQIG